MRSPSPIDAALASIRDEGVVAAATDTLVGLLALAQSAVAVSRVFEIKGADRRAPLPVLVPDLETALRLVDPFPAAGRELAEQGWPGPLTLVLRARPGAFPEQLTAGRDTVGLRLPGASPALDLLRALGEPLTGTSANRSGEPPVSSTDDLDPLVAAAVACILAGEGHVGAASSVIDVTGAQPRTLR